MVWGATAYDSRSTLIVMRGNLTGQRYVDDILRPHVGSFINGLPGAIFQKDNARPHTRNRSTRWMIPSNRDADLTSWMQEVTTHRRVRSHVPSCTNAHNDRRIVHMAVMDRAATSGTIAQQIQSVAHHSVSACTIRGRVQKSGMSASADITPSANKKQILASLKQIDNGANTLNGQLYSNDYEGRRVTRCIQVLPTTPGTAMDTVLYPKLGKKNCESFTF
ncbi:transposable element Tcb2 transposase [Trichonephila clavipes]|nr:transposable element Tcb2 transposase [Trichonephila clavipes]